jgi:hypothetical protein
LFAAPQLELIADNAPSITKREEYANVRKGAGESASWMPGFGRVETDGIW